MAPPEQPVADSTELSVEIAQAGPLLHALSGFDGYRFQPQDLPLLLVGGYIASGEGQPPTVYLNWCASHGQLRPNPLVPTGKPLASVDAFLESEAWQRSNPGDRNVGMLRLQTLRAMPASFQPNEVERQALLAAARPTPFWLDQRDQEQELDIIWNPTISAYHSRSA